MSYENQGQYGEELPPAPQPHRGGRIKAFLGGVAFTIIALPIAAGADYVLENGEHDAAVGRLLEKAQAHPTYTDPGYKGGAGTASASARPSETPTSMASESASPSATMTPRSAPTPRATKTPALSPTPTPAANAPLIVLDPGHDGKKYSATDPQTGLQDGGYPNHPEITEVYDVAQQVQAKLVADGYRVLLTKDGVNDNKTFRQRADIAIDNDAAIEVSVHDDHGQGPAFQAVYDQFIGGYRGAGHNLVACQNKAITAKSARYARIIADARSKAQGHLVTIQRNNFDNRSGLEPGNLAIMQLFACIGDKNGQHAVPEVYNEMGAMTDGSTTMPATPKMLQRYATGLINGIEAAVPLPTAAR